MVEHGVDALAAVPAETRRGTVAFDTPHVPMLALNRRPTDQHPFLGPDDDLAGRLAARHLLDRGLRRFAYLGGPAYGSVRSIRVSAVRREIEGEGGCLVHDLPGDTSLQAGMELADQWLRLEGAVDAVIGHSDVVVLGVTATLRRLGHDPSGLAMVGFDGLGIGVLAAPELTTVAIGPGVLGRQAALTTLALAAGEHVPTEQLLAPRVFTWGQHCGDDPFSPAADPSAPSSSVRGPRRSETGGWGQG